MCIQCISALSRLKAQVQVRVMSLSPAFLRVAVNHAYSTSCIIPLACMRTTIESGKNRIAIFHTRYATSRSLSRGVPRARQVREPRSPLSQSLANQTGGHSANFSIGLIESIRDFSASLSYIETRLMHMYHASCTFTIALRETPA